MKIQVARFSCSHPSCVGKTKDYSSQTINEHIAIHLMNDTGSSDHFNMSCSCSKKFQFSTLPYATAHLDQHKYSYEHRIQFRDVSRSDVASSKALVVYLSRFVVFKENMDQEDNNTYLPVVPASIGDSQIRRAEARMVTTKPTDGLTMFGQNHRVPPPPPLYSKHQDSTTHAIREQRDETEDYDARSPLYRSPSPPKADATRKRRLAPYEAPPRGNNDRYDDRGDANARDRRGRDVCNQNANGWNKRSGTADQDNQGASEWNDGQFRDFRKRAKEDITSNGGRGNVYDRLTFSNKEPRFYSPQPSDEEE